MTASEAISRNVRRLRTARGWTQAEACARLAVITGNTWSNASWSAAEKQTRGYSWRADDLKALSTLFGVTLDELFDPTLNPRCPTCGQDVPA